MSVSTGSTARTPEGEPVAGAPRRGRPGASAALLAALLAAALAIRLWSIGHGLPFVYNPDEELHFVPRAVKMLGGSLNPGYFENPPALTYLLNVVFRLRFLEGFPFGAGTLRREFLADPTAVYVTARVTVALIGTAVVGLVYLVGRRFYDARVGLVAAAIIAFAFLPVFYSKQALNDVVTLAPIAVALLACLLVAERGHPLDWALAGAATGVATATKYTAGAMLAVLGVSALFMWRGRRGDPLRAALLGLVGAGFAFVIAFFALNPFALVDVGRFLQEVKGQSDTAGGSVKLGQDDVPGWAYYVWTLTWGLGVAPALAALAGAVLALRADARKGLLLIVFPLLLFLFLGAQARYFGRWLMPAYPALAVLAGYAAVRLADRLPLGPRGRALALGGIAAVLVLQGAVASVHSSRILGREDTRAQSRRWLLANVPPGSGVVVEPFVPHRWLAAGGHRGRERLRRFPVKRPFQGYTRRLEPALVDRYRRGGYCWVVTASHQKGRGLKAGLPNAKAYYRRLDGTSTRAALFTPFAAGAEAVPFNFDLSFNYSPAAYERPGPLVEVRRLRGCRAG